MKKIIVIVLVITFIGIYFLKTEKSYIDIKSGIKSGSYALHVDVPESEGTRVVFSRTAEFSNHKFTGSGFDIKDSSAKGSVIALIDNIEPLGMKQFLLPFFVNYGGSGTFLYIGLFSIDKKRINHLDSLFVGDRVELLNLTSVDNLKIILEYNGYKKGRSMSTIPDNYTKVDLLLKDNKFIKDSIN
jgi:hypothetical protein